ncbi:nitroreductase [Sphingomonas sp. LY54]|uniref:nitroreductase family protein n=1 Tax=Sphingomonas sp. LY54 TaxID=3095343 RepID=UPI002D783221|nr:nitroreductase [Sphingomonas sp. LY54]WRP30263.1 nitroreductase [Sphingomonas sp. LY54]
MFNDRSSTLSLLRTRRSARPRDLVAPGPDDAQLRQIFEAAMRVPDHGKLAPWRFVHVSKAQRGAFRDLLERAYREEHPTPGRLELEAIDKFAHQAPTLVVALFVPVVPSKIPLWEQELSAGAALMNLLLATHALGFAGGWVTGWAANSATVARAFGPEGARIAGFVFIGTPGAELEERPRPDYDKIASDWVPHD